VQLRGALRVAGRRQDGRAPDQRADTQAAGTARTATWRTATWSCGRPRRTPRGRAWGRCDTHQCPPNRTHRTNLCVQHKPRTFNRTRRAQTPL